MHSILRPPRRPAILRLCTRLLLGRHGQASHLVHVRLALSSPCAHTPTRESSSTPMAQVILVGITWYVRPSHLPNSPAHPRMRSFATVGMFSAVSNLGAGGLSDVALSDTSNGVLYGCFAIAGIFSGAINNSEHSFYVLDFYPPHIRSQLSAPASRSSSVPWVMLFMSARSGGTLSRSISLLPMPSCHNFRPSDVSLIERTTPATRFKPAVVWSSPPQPSLRPLVQE